jgi:transglutaminase-like putative cysteine protease
MREFLESTKYIDWKSETIIQMASQLAKNEDSEEGIVISCFEFVRDEIKHSLDYKLNPVTCKASEVLSERTGYCFAKSHLLAALLRANNIPAALVYQRIAVVENEVVFYLHGLNAVFLNKFGWYRIDPRGLKEGLSSGFAPPKEILPFTPNYEGEVIFEKRWSEPSSKITSLLESCESYLSVIENLPSVNL